MQQTYKDVEYIFVNDCTRDSSVERLKEVIDMYSERTSQVRIINHETNRGLAMARQTGLNASTGDAVIFVDSDDYVDPYMIEGLATEMQRSNASIVDGGFGIVSSETTTEVHSPLHVKDKAYLKIILCQNVEPNRIWGRLIKKSLFDNNNIQFHQGINYGEDFSVMPRLLINAHRSWIDNPLYLYRKDNSQSYTNNITERNAISYLKAQEMIGSFMVSHKQWKDYSFATQLGWVSVWRFAKQFNIDDKLVKEFFTMSSSNFIARCLEYLMRCKTVHYSIANFLYLTVRRIYIGLISHE
jgi:glycosyltransferase involved in cell wall biosynthesis